MLKNRVLFFFPENPFSNRAGNTTRAKKNISILKKLGCVIDLVGCKEVYKYMDDSLDFDKNLVDNLTLIQRKPNSSLTSAAYWRYKWLKITGKKNKYNSLLSLYAKKDFESILQKKEYDYIIINYEIWSDLINSKFIKNAVKIVDTHDWMTLNEFYRNPDVNIGDKFNEEIENLKRFDKIITISQDETFVFQSFLGDKVINIPPSLPNNHQNERQKKWDLIFVGSENIFNIQSIGYFFEKIYPLLSKNISILVIGRIVNYVPNLENVEKILFVEDLSSYYHQSKIAICPMLQGTGIKIKVVEALSFGIPVVGTIRSVDGFSSKTNNGCLVSNNPEGFKNHILDLLEDKNYYKTIQMQGTQYFDANFSDEKSIDLWKSVIS